MTFGDNTFEHPPARSLRPKLTTVLVARVLRHDVGAAMTTLFFEDGELRAPIVDDPVGAAVEVRIDASDVAIALSRPMDVSITNRLPGEIVAIERLAPPYVQVSFSLGATRLDALVTGESVERLALEIGLRAWVMIKAVAISGLEVSPARTPEPRPWPSDRTSSRGKP
ncbi:TOBE domain-containing protein [Methylocella sp.]|uniref:TOBE domain-containing protein n=1 Tax=Methylocella sp. TaxID=1978226 RepID=UPI0035B3894C